MNETRPIDRLDTGPRFTDHDAVRLNRMFRGSETEEWLRAVIEGNLVGDMAIVSSFGAESAVLLHLVSEIDHSIPVLFLETGKHFPETLAYRDELTDLLGLNRVDVYPDLADLQSRDETGLRWSYDPDGCCELRKVRPLEKALARFDASLTGRKAFQSSTRANLPRFEVDTSDAQGRLKVNPLIDWKAEDIAAYMSVHELPRHPLVERGFPSIGCSPCTRAVAPGEDPRAGRWSGWDKVECGIHKPGEEPFL
ncbi:phosphoadenylyl-sulfate reductase [Erythrobacter gaetbuli]|uniref:Adenosine 5'-phosphosulfate reductase n=1 Tax=Qipengyuania gaetbuli TaxID=266952 RepID=A0A844Y1I3_9SPHN|nr:phosphoadenylyl-sulfate reductase [Qipengyuania gaetbuli]MXO51287.1 phosphoadenylyl-sulfate reductase [Qipengyuania gaetbuli]